MSDHTDEARTVMRAAPSAYVRFGLICGLMLLAWGFILSQRPAEPFARIAAVIVVAVCVTVMIWVIRFRLEYGGDTVRYRTLFGGETGLDVRVIATAKIVTGPPAYGDRFSPRIRLELVGKPGAPFRMVPVNVRIFRGDEVKRFTTFLSQRMASS